MSAFNNIYDFKWARRHSSQRSDLHVHFVGKYKSNVRIKSIIMVQLIDSPETIIRKVDAILLESINTSSPTISNCTLFSKMARQKKIHTETETVRQTHIKRDTDRQTQVQIHDNKMSILCISYFFLLLRISPLCKR